MKGKVKFTFTAVDEDEWVLKLQDSQGSHHVFNSSDHENDLTKTNVDSLNLLAHIVRQGDETDLKALLASRIEKREKRGSKIFTGDDGTVHFKPSVSIYL